MGKNLSIFVINPGWDYNNFRRRTFPPYSYDLNIYILILYFLAKSICKVMGMRCIRNKRLGAALTWFLRSKVSLENILNVKLGIVLCTCNFVPCICVDIFPRRMLPLLQFLQKSMYIIFILLIKIGFFLLYRRLLYFKILLIFFWKRDSSIRDIEQ